MALTCCPPSLPAQLVQTYWNKLYSSCEISETFLSLLDMFCNAREGPLWLLKLLPSAETARHRGGEERDYAAEWAAHLAQHEVHNSHSLLLGLSLSFSLYHSCDLLHYHRGPQLLLMQNHMLGAHRGGNLGYISTVPVEEHPSAQHHPFPTKPDTQDYPLTPCGSACTDLCFPRGKSFPWGSAVTQKAEHPTLQLRTGTPTLCHG